MLNGGGADEGEAFGILLVTSTWTEASEKRNSVR